MTTEVKRLRERAEAVAAGRILAGAHGLSEGTKCTPPGHGSTSASIPASEGSALLQLRLKVQTMRQRLAEALRVIQEQDRLIHAGAML